MNALCLKRHFGMWMACEQPTLSEDATIERSRVVLRHHRELLRREFVRHDDGLCGIAINRAVYIVTAFYGKKQGYEGVRRPVEQPCRQAIMLSESQTFEIVIWQIVTLGDRLLSPIKESPQVR